MPPALLPPNEPDRLAALHAYEILDTASEAAYDDLAALAARLTGSPIAAISLIDAGRQWVKASVGVEVREVPRDQSFCAHAILTPEAPLLVPDTTQDARFLDNAFVTGPLALRAYLGVPLVDPQGHALGSLCVADHTPRAFDSGAVGTMQTLARAVMANLELRRALRQSREAALTDPLTGLPNRRATMAALAEGLAAGKGIAVVAIDLDHFKEANDSEGHAAGDTLLQMAAQRLRATLRPSDWVGRIGGDEFVVLLPGIASREAAAAVAQRISGALRQPVPFGDRVLRLGATLGVAIAPDDMAEGASAQASAAGVLLRIADEALVRTKQAGRGGIGHARAGDTARLLRAAIILRAFDASLPDAAAARSGVAGATLRLQPIVATDAAATIVAFEALGRWSHPDTGAVPPAELLATIGPERTARFSYAVRDQALAAFAALRASAGGPRQARLAVNLSAAEVSRAGIGPQLAAQVRAAGLTLRDIEVEITEEVLLDRVSDSTLEQLAALRGQGARLVLDDFGTGNSGLSHLLRLPLDGVKLDKRFVQRLGLDARAVEIVRATVSLARGLGLAVVAEGVEDTRQATMLRALGCDAMQGFLYAMPMTPAELPDWLLRHAGRLPMAL